MNRVFVNVVKRGYATSALRRAEAAPQGSTAALVLNFCTPHSTILLKKTVDRVILPGETGEYGITAGHSPLISQLKPGVVSVVHLGGETDKYFVPGGFAITQANSVTDVSVPEAFPLSDFDEASVRASYAEASKTYASAPEGVAKVTAQIEVDTYGILARALNLTL